MDVANISRGGKETHTHTRSLNEKVSYRSSVSRTTLSPWSRAILQKLIVSQRIKKSFLFYVNRRFIILSTRSRH